MSFNDNPKGGSASDVAARKQNNKPIKPRAIRMTIKEELTLSECPPEIKRQIEESNIPYSTEDQDVFVTFKVKI
jgi:hypothetical protein